MIREIKFMFVVERKGIKYLSDKYELLDDGLPSHNQILEDMESDCTCDLNESTPCCDGSCMQWEDGVIVGRLQSTGLKDKNNEEIYEEYIIKVDGIACLVDWLDGSFVLIGPDIHAEIIGPQVTYFNNSEIIGNLHQDPELLE